MIGIGMPMAQARMPFMGGLLWLQERNAEGWGVVPGGYRLISRSSASRIRRW